MPGSDGVAIQWTTRTTPAIGMGHISLIGPMSLMGHLLVIKSLCPLKH